MIYFDGVHLASPDLEELHSFAAKLGINKCWFEGTRKGHPHYDIKGKNLNLFSQHVEQLFKAIEENPEINCLFYAEYILKFVSTRELITKCFK